MNARQIARCTIDRIDPRAPAVRLLRFLMHTPADDPARKRVEELLQLALERKQAAERRNDGQ
jgi:hypothetical protein